MNQLQHFANERFCFFLLGPGQQNLESVTAGLAKMHEFLLPHPRLHLRGQTLRMLWHPFEGQEVLGVGREVEGYEENLPPYFGLADFSQGNFPQSSGNFTFPDLPMGHQNETFESETGHFDFSLEQFFQGPLSPYLWTQRKLGPHWIIPCHDCLGDCKFLFSEEVKA